MPVKHFYFRLYVFSILGAEGHCRVYFARALRMGHFLSVHVKHSLSKGAAWEWIFMVHGCIVP